jgi:hypothetical protein
VSAKTKCPVSAFGFSCMPHNNLIKKYVVFYTQIIKDKSTKVTLSAIHLQPNPRKLIVIDLQVLVIDVP